MTDHERLSSFAGLLGEPTRARMVAALMGGSALPATDLALAARVRPSTASGHLALLVDGGLLAVERQGRHRYYRLAGQHVADLVEAIAGFRPAGAAAMPSAAPLRLRRARTCYDHLAGELGVALTEALVARGALVDDHSVYRLGGTAAVSIGEVFDIRPADRVGKKCLDWTERRHHCGGRLGAAITRRLFDLRWVVRTTEPRVVEVTALGRRGLATHFGVDASGEGIGERSDAVGRPSRL